MKKLIIFGTSTMAKVAHFFFSKQQNYEVAGFTVDNSHRDVDIFCGIDVFDFENLEKTHPPSEYDVFVAIGPTKMNTVREAKFAEAKAKGFTLASFVSDRAACHSELGENCFVGDFANIQPFASIGDNVFVWEFAVVANEASVGSHCFLSPRSIVSTFAHLGRNCFLGTGSIIKTRVLVGEYALIGAASYISADTEPNAVFGQRHADYLGNISQKIDISR